MMTAEPNMIQRGISTQVFLFSFFNGGLLIFQNVDLWRLSSFQCTFNKMDTFYPIANMICILSIQLEEDRTKKNSLQLKLYLKYHGNFRMLSFYLFPGTEIAQKEQINRIRK